MSEVDRLAKLCEEQGCQKEAVECHLGYGPSAQEDVFYWYCVDHARKHGFCYCCGEFWGGVNSFEFSRTGLCENCESELEAGGGIPIKSVEQLEALAKALVKTFNYYREQAKKNMTRDQAEFIRKLRVEDGYSWRAVARRCHDNYRFKDWPKWKPESSQPMGMALCERAAEIFGENYQGEPWN